jgi:hypothetical protein
LSELIATDALADRLRTAWRATDWSSRVRVPAFLRAAGLTVSADSVASIPEQLDPASIVAARATAADAARTAYAEWLYVKPPLGSPGCLAARTAALDAATSTVFACAHAAVLAAQEITQSPEHQTAVVVLGDLENAARWAACVIALKPDALAATVAEILKERRPWQQP